VIFLPGPKLKPRFPAAIGEAGASGPGWQKHGLSVFSFFQVQQNF
jgi:hypothetical protein